MWLLFTAKWLIPLYRILLSLSFVIVPYWLDNKILSLDSGTGESDLTIRGVATIFIGYGMLEHVVVSLIHNNLQILRWYYLLPLFASDVATPIYMIFISIKYNLDWVHNTVIFTVLSVLLCLRIMYVIFLKRLVYNERNYFNTEYIVEPLNGISRLLWQP